MAFRLLLDGVERQVEILRRRPHLVVAVDGREHVVENPGEAGDGLRDLVVAGRPLRVARAQAHGALAIRAGGRSFAAALLAEGEDEAGAGSGEIRAPMPGAVVALHVAPGQRVAAGEPALTIESMKLQTVLAAPRAGIVAGILVAEGDSFEKDQALLRLEEEAAADA